MVKSKFTAVKTWNDKEFFKCESLVILVSCRQQISCICHIIDDLKTFRCQTGPENVQKVKQISMCTYIFYLQV